MSSKGRKKTDEKKGARQKRKARVRGRVFGKADRPRLAVFRSNSNLYAQLIDDEKSITLASASTLDEENKGKTKCNIEGAKKIGNLIAKRGLAKNITSVVFDRGGYLYHGRVKALADGAREGGLKF